VHHQPPVTRARHGDSSHSHSHSVQQRVTESQAEAERQFCREAQLAAAGGVRCDSLQIAARGRQPTKAFVGEDVQLHRCRLRVVRCGLDVQSCTAGDGLSAASLAIVREAKHLSRSANVSRALGAEHSVKATPGGEQAGSLTGLCKVYLICSHDSCSSRSPGMVRELSTMFDVLKGAPAGACRVTCTRQSSHVGAARPCVLFPVTVCQYRSVRAASVTYDPRMWQPAASVVGCCVHYGLQVWPRQLGRLQGGEP